MRVHVPRMKKRRPQGWTFYNSVYPCRIHIRLDTDPKVAVRWVNQKLGSGFESGADLGTAARTFHEDDCADAAIVFYGLPDDGTMAHEAFHVVRHIMATIGMPLSDESDEAYAYLLGWLVREISRRLYP